jgi:peptidoglycan/LPS O-acetylase OafA/YrhL
MPSYRPDVDGLRAVAVLAVLAFHAFPDFAPGGFAGVDVFFVISGFLITGIILGGLADGSFTFAGFYWRRVRRLFPALVLVLAACLALGWLVLLPDEYRQLGRHVAAGAGFVSNIVLWREAGYFDTAAELKPLLHLWSLGVEEQYYLVWPVLLVLLRKSPQLMFCAIVGVAAASLAANLWLTYQHPDAAFFLPVGRFWELLCGSLLAYLAHHRRLAGGAVELKAWLGAALLAASAALLDPLRDFPGAWALLPVMGTVLVVWAGPCAWINRRVLAHPAAVLLGLISYPLYLWHWPLLAFARIVHGGEPPLALRVALCALSVLLAWMTYELLEKKVRHAGRWALQRRAVPALAGSMAALGLAGILALQGSLAPQSASLPQVREISSASSDWDHGGKRTIPGDSGRSVLFFGDSHMQQLWPRVKKVATERAAPVHTILLRSAGGCAPVPGIERKGYRCASFVEQSLRLAREPHVETVVIAASWLGFVRREDYYRVGDPERVALDLAAPESEWVLQGFQAALAQLTAAGKRVVLVLSAPRGAALDPKSIIDRDGLTVRLRTALPAVPRSELAALTGPIDARLRRIAAAVGASVIDPAEWLCTASLCPAFDESGRPLYRDASHLRASTARERFTAVDPYVYARR